MNKFAVRMTVAVLAAALMAGAALADAQPNAKKKKKNFLERIFATSSDKPAKQRNRRAIFGKDWENRPGNDVRIISEAPSKRARKVADADPEGDDSGFGPGNLTYVPDKQVALGGAAPAEPRPADPAAGAIHDALADTELGIRVVPEVRQAIRDHYAAQGFRPLWSANGQLASRATAVLDVLAAAADEGLQPQNYLPPALTGYEAARTLSPADHALLARLDLGLTAMALKYAREASGGQFEPSRLSRYHDIKPERVPVPQALKVLAWSPFPDAYLRSLHPTHPAYAALKAELAVLRKEAGGEAIAPIARGDRVKKGQSDPRLPALRDRLAANGVVLDLPADPLVLDEALSDALRIVQENAGLNATGNLDNATVNALNNHGGEQDKRRLLANMERLRWFPRNLARSHVFVNQPAFEVHVVKDGAEVWQSKVIVGKANTQTSVFNDEMEMVVFNPSWGVPPSIIANEYLPKLRRDPGYLDRIGFKVTTASGQKISSRAVNWGAYGNKVPFSIQQPPGSKNALGELKFLFPNSHNIYMHDTPNRELFSEEVRAFSHGCVRVENPREFASVLLGWDREKVDANTDSKKSQTVRLTQKLPVHIAYFTAWPDESGQIRYFNDIYGRDEALLNAMTTTTVASK